jgi:Meckel syndrome type 1 protein
VAQDDRLAPGPTAASGPPGAPPEAATTGPAGIAPVAPPDPCADARSAAQDACALADRMSALAAATQERLREARHAYEEHAGRRERAAAVADPRAVRAAKDAAQAAFRAARLDARDRATLEAAAREWLREIEHINTATRDAVRVLTREDAAELSLLRAVERLGVEADGARIAAESAAEACRNARISLATCEEQALAGAAALAAAAAGGGARGTLAPTAVATRTTVGPPPTAAGREAAAPPAAAELPAAAAAALPPAAAAEEAPAVSAGESAPAAPMEVAGTAADHPPSTSAPAILPLLEGDHDVLRRIATALAGGDPAAEGRWQAHLAALAAAVTARAIDSAMLAFPEQHPFWGLYTQQQCREITAALAALGYRFDGRHGFEDGRVPGQRELSLAVGYAGQDPMRIRFWPTEAEMPHLFVDVHVESGRFLAEAAGDLALGDMIDLLGRRAEDLGDLWNAWGRVRPLLLAPA